VAPKAIILYDGNCIEWNIFVADVEMLLQPEMREAYGLLQFNGPGLVSRTIPLGHAQAKFMALLQHGSLSLCHILRHFSNWKATKPVDKIYAVLGLTDDAQVLYRMVDYDKPTIEVLLAVSFYFIKRSELLDVLHFAGIGWGDCGRDPKLPQFPSWVVDWTRSRMPISLAHSYTNEAAQYSAATAKPQQIIQDGSVLTLKMKAIVIDAIEKMGPTDDFYDLEQERYNLKESWVLLLKWLDAIQQFVQTSVSDPYRNGQGRMEALSRLMIGDRTSSARPAPPEYITSFTKLRDFIQALTTRFQAQPDLARLSASMAPRTTAEYDTLLEVQNMFNKVGSPFQFLFGQASFSRRLAVTVDGYLAAVPALTEPGDVIVAVLGAQVPFVLRPASATGQAVDASIYRLVGECYAHGMMDGEAFRLGREEEWVRID